MDIEKIRCKLREICETCEWSGYKVKSEPYYIHCKLKIEEPEKCILHYNNTAIIINQLEKSGGT